MGLNADVFKRNVVSKLVPLFCGLRDHRHRQGRRYAFADVLRVLLSGVLSGQRHLRMVEDVGRRQGINLSDTQLWRILSGLSAKDLSEKLTEQIKSYWQGKVLSAADGHVAIDGKTIWVGKHCFSDALCQRMATDKTVRWRVQALRAASIAGSVRLTIGQQLHQAGENDASAFPAFFKDLVTQFGGTGLLKVVSVDAGFTSYANATLVNDAGIGYVMALKQTQKVLFAEARRLLGGRDTPQVATAIEQYHGANVRWLLFRTTAMAGYHDWAHLREVWRVHKEITAKDGTITTEDHYYLTNMPTGSTKGLKPLTIVRGHWGIENNSNCIMDLVYREDDCPWSSKAIGVVSLIRLIALNFTTTLKYRTCISSAMRQRTWSLFLKDFEHLFSRMPRSWLKQLLSSGKIEQACEA